MKYRKNYLNPAIQEMRKDFENFRKKSAPRHKANARDEWKYDVYHVIPWAGRIRNDLRNIDTRKLVDRCGFALDAVDTIYTTDYGVSGGSIQNRVADAAGDLCPDAAQPLVKKLLGDHKISDVLTFDGLKGLVRDIVPTAVSTAISLGVCGALGACGIPTNFKIVNGVVSTGIGLTSAGIKHLSKRAKETETNHEVAAMLNGSEGRGVGGDGLGSKSRSRPGKKSRLLEFGTTAFAGLSIVNSALEPSSETDAIDNIEAVKNRLDAAKSNFEDVLNDIKIFETEVETLRDNIAATFDGPDGTQSASLACVQQAQGKIQDSYASLDRIISCIDDYKGRF
nr:hypothetical protein [Bifidobacterium dentium]